MFYIDIGTEDIEYKNIDLFTLFFKRLFVQHPCPLISIDPSILNYGPITTVSSIIFNTVGHNLSQ